jgi:hypothetical protein
MTLVIRQQECASIRRSQCIIFTNLISSVSTSVAVGQIIAIVNVNHHGPCIYAGTGAWILNCARSWRVGHMCLHRNATELIFLIRTVILLVGPRDLVFLCTAHRIHVTGLDIVPLQPDLQRMGLSDLASRITWVQANLCDVPSCPSCTLTELPWAVLMGYHFPMKSLILC